MAFDPISAALDIGGKLIDRLWPDPAQRDAAKLELLKMQQSGELAQLAAETELAKGQLAVNAEEAKSGSVFVSGWRPAIGWICGMALFSEFIARPFFLFSAHVFGFTAAYPELDMGDLTTLLFGMLGLGAMRTHEKVNGVTK